MKLVFASNNQHKLEEVRACLHESSEIISLADVWPGAVLAETADTLEGNAILKAEQVFTHTGKICISDDSGLEVDALDGRPGVFSARFAGEQASDAENRNHLLNLLEYETIRTARFRTVICLKTAQEHVFFEGVLDGSIARVALGHFGFGYDSIFIPAGQTRTLAEFRPEEKNAVSHRSIALNKLLQYLRKIS